jgi:DNA-directed RNA polymerase subunit H (RpoH/RPB5)
MTTTSKHTLSIFKSRKNITDILKIQGYDVSDYNSFSINEVDAMFSNSQLDMLLTHTNGISKTYIKYYLNSKQIKKQTLDEIIEDLFTLDTILEKNDTLIVITEDEPNDTIISHNKYIYDTTGIFVVIHSLKRLQFNILNHKFVPPTVILSPIEVDELKIKYNINKLSQLPEISRFDPHALALSLRPGQVCKHDRNSITAMKTTYYRACV